MSYTIEPTPRQRELELEVIARYDKTIKMNRIKSRAGSKDYKRKTTDKPKPDGKLIRKLMNQAKMKPKDLYTKAGINSSQIQKMFRGVGTDLCRIEAVAMVLEVDVKYLVKK